MDINKLERMNTAQFIQYKCLSAKWMVNFNMVKKDISSKNVYFFLSFKKSFPHLNYIWGQNTWNPKNKKRLDVTEFLSVGPQFLEPNLALCTSTLRCLLLLHPTWATRLCRNSCSECFHAPISSTSQVYHAWTEAYLFITENINWFLVIIKLACYWASLVTQIV